jgi:DNA polymerase-3 subunit delta'
MSKKTIYSWQDAIWQQLAAMRQRHHHALLLRGAKGIGKLDFAVQLSKSILCERPVAGGLACTSCSSCNWFDLGNHPDFRLLSPEQEVSEDEEAIPAKKTGKKSQISIAQVRELGDFLELVSHRSGGSRIVLIHPAEALNQASANALLKMLEEPPNGAMFILVAHQAQKLLPTIMSRCHKIDMPVPAEAQALEWLKQQGVQDPQPLLDYAGGSPLAALETADESANKLPELWKNLSKGAGMDAFSSASIFVSHGMETAILALQKWIYDLATCKLTGQIRYHMSLQGALQALAKSVDLGLLLDFQRKLDEARKSATHPLNNEMQLESLLIQYTQLFLTTTKP